MTDTKALKDDVAKFVKDLGIRALHTLWQTAVAVAGVLWAASGLNVHDLLTVDGRTKLVTVVVSGVVAACLSAFKTTVLAYTKSNGATLEAEILTDVSENNKAVESPLDSKYHPPVAQKITLVSEPVDPEKPLDGQVTVQ